MQFFFCLPNDNITTDIAMNFPVIFQHCRTKNCVDFSNGVAVKPVKEESK
jgi:hypothetical protein